MSEPIKENSAVISLDAMAEDLFGLNIRGVKTILAAWANPRRYFAASRTPDWQDSYTPSIRLWLSFFALLSLLRFWWIGGNEGMIGAYATGFTQAGLIVPEGLTIQDIGREAVLFVFTLIPFLQVFAMVLVALVYPFWGERTTITQRQRYLFAVIVPSASLMPFLLTIMLLVPEAQMVSYGIFLALVALIVDLQTGYRGGFEQVSGFGRIWRAGLLATLLVVLNTTLSILSQIAGIVIISQKYGVAPPG